MVGSAQYDDRLVTRSQIASWAGVARPTVTFWGRSPSFPTPVRAGEAELFHQAAVLAWLDTRTVPRKSLQAPEPEGTTYGHRARRALGLGAEVETSATTASARISVVTGALDQIDHLDEARVRELMGDLADRVRGAGSMVDYMYLPLSLYFLRIAGVAEQWDEVQRRAAQGTVEGAGALLRLIGSAVDERLKDLGVVPGMRDALLRLEPRTYRDLRRVIEVAGQLGHGAFRQILCEYETRAGLRSDEFFTPRAVVSIMTQVARTHSDEKLRSGIYDPYARGGELLVAAAASYLAEGHGPAALDVHGFTTDRDTGRLAAMNLAVQGVRPHVRLSRGAPWTVPAVERPGPVSGFGLVLTNPPFNTSDSVGDARTDGEWPYGAPPVGNDTFAHVQHALTLLAEGGSAAVVMPQKAGNSANRAELEIRRNLVERGVVRCVIALPARLFTSTPVPVSLWFLTHPARPSNEVQFLDARNVGVAVRGKRVLSESDIQAVVDACGAGGSSERDAQGQGVLSTVVSREALRDRDYSLSPTDHFLAQRSDRAAAEAAVAEAWREMEVRRRELESAGKAVTATELSPEEPRWQRTEASDGLPEGWSEVLLENICQINAGPSYTLLGAEQRTPDGEVPVVFPRHMRHGHIDDAGDERILASLARRLSGFRLQAGDIVCIRSGAMGPPALVRGRQDGWMMSPNLLRLRVRDGVQADPEYLLGYLCRPDAVAWVRRRAAATAAPSISAAALGLQPVILPPLDEQRRIAGALAAMEVQEAAHRQFADAVLEARAAMAERLMGGWSQTS